VNIQVLHKNTAQNKTASRKTLNESFAGRSGVVGDFLLVFSPRPAWHFVSVARDAAGSASLLIQSEGLLGARPLR